MSVYGIATAVLKVLPLTESRVGGFIVNDAPTRRDLEMKA